ncbi:MAG TPA: enoyl-CoA hydratase-related protein [Caulobacteraceae bacterium]|jgi:enoyl-CoA hydratase|nr:enoyl-CoA hydratase-related protein [Caulobacteraceae bacterium]
MAGDLVLKAIDGPVARLTLNDPDRANVLSTAMMDALGAALAEAAADIRVRVVVLGGRGGSTAPATTSASCAPRRTGPDTPPCSPNARP